MVPADSEAPDQVTLGQRGMLAFIVCQWVVDGV